MAVRDASLGVAGFGEAILSSDWSAHLLLTPHWSTRIVLASHWWMTVCLRIFTPHWITEVHIQIYLIFYSLYSTGMKSYKNTESSESVLCNIYSLFTIYRWL